MNNLKDNKLFIPMTIIASLVFFVIVCNKIIVDKDITDRAKHIIGNKVGLAAAKAIYNWVINNIYYISISLNQSDNLIPQSSLETLNNRYGDCKAIEIGRAHV